MAVLAAVVPAGAQMAPKGEPLAEGDGDMIAAKEVDNALAAQLIKLHEQLYNLKR